MFDRWQFQLYSKGFDNEGARRTGYGECVLYFTADTIT